MPRAAVIVGLGGVGKVVLMKMRRLIVEEYGSLSALPNVRFLHADTFTDRKKEIGQNFDQKVLGEDILFDEGLERVELSNNLDQSDPQKLVTHSKVKEWFPDNLPITCDFAEGAGGVRSFGRIAFHYNVHEFRKAINKTAQKASETGTSGFDAYLVCSLFGGTGSGALLDVCYNIREVLQNMGLNHKILGFLIIGAMNPDSTMQSNCYAALKELEYYTTKGIQTTLNEAGRDELIDYFKNNHIDLRPFRTRYPVDGIPDIISEFPPVDNCYLLGAVNAEEIPFDRDSLEEAVARRIFFELMPGVSDPMRGKRVDIMGQPAYYTPDRLQRRAKSFFTTGLSVLEFPAPRIINALASGLAAFCCHYALFRGAAGFSDLKGDLEKFIEKMGLTEKRLKRELEKQDTGTVRDSIKDDRDGWKRRILTKIEAEAFDQDSLEQDILKVRAEAIDRIREGQDTESSGVYVQTIRNNGSKIWRDMEIKIEELIGSYVGSKDKGPENTEGFISALVSRLSSEKDGYSNMKESFDRRMRDAKRRVDWRIERFKDDLSPKYLWELKKHAHWLCERDLALFLNLGEEKIFYSTAHDLVHNTRDKLDRLKAQVDDYKKSLNNWKIEYLKNMVDVFKNLNAQLNDDPVNNGLRDILGQLPDEPVKWETNIAAVYKDFLVPFFKRYNITNPITDIDVVAEEIIKGICDGELGIAPFRAVLSNPETFKKGVFEACRKRFETIKNVSVCDLLLQVDKTARRETLNKKKKEAAWLLQTYTQDETIDHVPDLCEKKWVGVSSKINNNHQIWKDLSEYGTEARFMSLEEPYRMVFVGEMGVFCLRNLKLLGSYKKTYDSMKDKDRRHTNKEIEFLDIMPPDPRLQHIHLRAESAALMGRILDFLKEEMDPVNHYPAIFLYYSDKATKTKKNERLCKEWKEVEQTLRDIQVKKEIERKTVEATTLEKLEIEINNAASSAKTREEKEALWQITDRYLKIRLDDLKDEKHPFYQKDLNIIEGFRKGYNLHPPEGKRS